jgi:hypothetical protein
MKKDEAETQIRYLCHEWARHKNYSTDGSVDPSFSEFQNWVRDQGYGSVFDFRARGGPIYYANLWFDDVFKQTWKN